VRILDQQPEPLTELTYRRARIGGGTETARLPVEVLRVNVLPEGCAAVIAASDLQGVASSPLGGEPTLLGMALADHLAVWAANGMVPAPEHVGVVLAGDLFSAPGADRRGATGDVTDVWLAFAAAGFRWVVGVAGNHDEISVDSLTEFGLIDGVLDGTCVERDGFRFSGVAGIIGDPSRPGRRDESSFLAGIRRCMSYEPAVLVLHEGPSGGESGQPGHLSIGACLESHAPLLTICGHTHWDAPVAKFGDGHLLNVDGRVIILTT
jgi:hypothetical protein